MVKVSVIYEGNFHCLAVHGPSGASLATDAPADNLGKGEAFSPTDLTVTSLANCMLTTMAIVAKKQGWSLDLTGTKARVVKHMTASTPRRIARIEVDVEVPLPASTPERAALENAARTCPVALSLHPDVEKALTFRWNAG